MAVKGLQLLAFVLAVFASGCGDREKSALPSAQRTGPPQAQRPRSVEPRQAAAARPEPAATAKARTPQQQPWPEGVPRDDVFQAYVTPRSNYRIGPASGGPHPQDWFVAVRPDADSDSTNFSARLPEWAHDKGAPSIDTRLPAGFTAVPAAGYTPDGWPRRIHCESNGAEMVYVAGGVFIQGMDDADPNAAPSHPAAVDSFYIDRTEVTIAQYQRFLAEGSIAGRPPPAPTNPGAPANHPALGVPWRAAQAYAEWAHKSLPTESEWELAARGPRSFVYPWGNGRAVWERRRTRQQIDPVGAFRSDRTVFHVLDMAGNAREWVADFYLDKAYQQATPRDGSVTRNWTGPKRPSPANHKVVKGGGPDWQLWHRASASMRDSAPDIAIRCVLRLDTEPKSASATPIATPVSSRRLPPPVPAP